MKAANDRQVKHLYTFGEFRLDAGEKVLTRGGETVQLTPKAFETLLLLVENHGRVLGRDELLDRVWPDTYVEENNLTRHISMLRKVLGDGSEGQRFIETVPRRGYRFAAGVREEAAVLLREKTRAQVVFEEEEELGEGEAGASASAGAGPDARGDVETSGLTLAPSKQPAHQRHRNYYLLVGLVLAVAGLGYGLYRSRTDQSAGSRPRPATQRLTANGKTRLAAVAPDGRLLAFVTDDGARQSLWLKNIAAGSDMRALPSADNTTFKSLTFSPDGNFIYYGSEGALFRLPVLGDSPKKVLPDYDGPITFSPDGKQFAYLAPGGEETVAVFIAYADGKSRRVLASSKRPVIFGFNGSWSPDGKAIACYALTPDSNQRVAVVSVTDGSVSVIQSPAWGRITQVLWKKGGGGLLVVATANGQIHNQIWSLSYPGGEARKITDDYHNYESVSLSADGTLLTAVRTEQDAHLWVMPAEEEAGRARQITSGDGRYDGVYAISWTTDGRIIYENAPDGRLAVWRVDPDGRDPKELSRESLTTAASPDGKFLVSQRDERDGTGLFRTEVGTGEQKRLTTGTDIFPTFSPDGQWVVFTRYAGDVALWRVPLAGGEVVKLTEAAGRLLYPAVSPDGKLIAFFHVRSVDFSVKPQQPPFPALAVVPFEGGGVVKEFDVQMQFMRNAKSALQFTPDGQAINYISARGDISNIWRQPLDGGPPAQVTNFESGRIFNFAYSPDGRQLAISRGTFNRDVVLITDF